MQQSEQASMVAAGESRATPEIYGEGFGAVFRSERYAVFSRFLARIAVALLKEHGVPGSALLDLACGAGVGTEVLAHAGYEICALDGSPVMVRCTQERTSGAGLAVEVQCQDMRQLAYPPRFDAVTCLFDSLNYLLDERELADVFSRVAGALVPRGLFVFDMNTPHGLATRWGTRDVISTARADLFEVNRNRYDAERAVNTTTTIVFVREGTGDLFRRYTEIHRQRGYPAPVITGLIEKAGLSVVAVSGLSDMYRGLADGLQPLSDEAGRIVVVARKDQSRE